MAGVMINGLEFKPTRKKDYDVYVCRPKFGTKVHNRLENIDYVTNEQRQFVISGTVGETWVIDINKLVKTYRFMDGRPITPEALKARIRDGIIDWMHLKTATGGGQEVNFAAHLPISIKNYPVQTSWGGVRYANRTGLSHGRGDFLVCSSVNGQPNPADTWVVNGLVFANTYDMRAFQNMRDGRSSTETPRPKSILGARSSQATRQPAYR